MISANDVTVSGLAVFGGNLDVRLASGSGAIVEDMVIGTRADSFTDPGAAVRSTGSAGVGVASGSGAIVRNNLIGYQSQRGVGIGGGTVTSLTISGNEIRGTSIGTTIEGGGIELVTYWSGGTVNGLTISGNLIDDGVADFAMEIATAATDSGLLIDDNTVSGTNTMLVYGTPNTVGGTITNNKIVDSPGFGVQVADVSNSDDLEELDLRQHVGGDRQQRHRQRFARRADDQLGGQRRRHHDGRVLRDRPRRHL